MTFTGCILVGVSRSEASAPICFKERRSEETFSFFFKDLKDKLGYLFDYKTFVEFDLNQETILLL